MCVCFFKTEEKILAVWIMAPVVALLVTSSRARLIDYDSLPRIIVSISINIKLVGIFIFIIAIKIIVIVIIIIIVLTSSSSS